jgi:hypothetical protein
MGSFSTCIQDIGLVMGISKVMYIYLLIILR